MCPADGEASVDKRKKSLPPQSPHFRRDRMGHEQHKYTADGGKQKKLTGKGNRSVGEGRLHFEIKYPGRSSGRR